MEFQLYHNKLIDLKNMGFSITWSLIEDGLSYNEELGLNFNYTQLIDFLKSILGQTTTNEDDIIQIICCEEDNASLKNQLHQFANREYRDLNLNLRKWRAVMLHKKLCNKNTTLVDLYVFWLTYPTIYPTPFFYPKNSVTFFSQEKNDAIQKNRDWLKDEVENIIATDKAISVF